MEITIKRYSRKLTYEDAATLDEFWELAKRTERSLDREQRRHWDGRECDEYIIAAQGVLPYCATPEELVCQQETMDEILAVLALCTPTQRERFLLYALYDYVHRSKLGFYRLFRVPIEVISGLVFDAPHIVSVESKKRGPEGPLFPI